MAKAQPAPTAAEEELAQRDVSATDSLEQDAKDQRKQQRAEVRAGAGGVAVQAGENPSEFHRSDHVQFNSVTSPERPDQYTVSNPNDQPFYGHFVTVTGGEHEGAYGAYFENVVGTGDGATPLVVKVRTRDANNEVLLVKYDDLAPAESRGNAPR
jgi:hypothetical protein